MHVVTSRRVHKGREYETTLVRRSYRDGGRVRKQTLANLSHLPPEAVDAVRRVLRGETLVGAGEALAIERSLGHGHVAAVLACCAISTSSGCSRASAAASATCAWR